MVYNIKAGIAATASLAGTAMAYKKSYENSSSRNSSSSSGSNFAVKATPPGKGGKLHEDAVKQMQMWKY